MTADEQLRWEADNAPRFAAAAFASAALSLGAFVVQIAVIGGGADNEREALLRIDEHHSQFFLSLGLQALAYIALAGALFYLARGIMARREEGLVFLWPLIALAPVLLIVGGVLTQIDLGRLADDFLSSGPRTNARAEDLLDDRSVVSSAIASGGTLCMALSYVLVSINAMRAGLLSRFMGILGVIVGALLVLPLLPGGGNFLQLFWVAALGFLFLGRWPNGRGPAWDVVEPIPWPTAADVQAARAAAADAEAGDGEAGEAELPAGEPEPEPDAGVHEPGPRRPASRKKKRRR